MKTIGVAEGSETFMPAAAALSSLSSFCSLRMSGMNEREKSCGAAQPLIKE